MEASAAAHRAANFGSQPNIDTSLWDRSKTFGVNSGLLCHDGSDPRIGDSSVDVEDAVLDLVELRCELKPGFEEIPSIGDVTLDLDFEVAILRRDNVPDCDMI